ncbi:zinc metalloproteinase nas-4-like [Penaeus monodon]|uniref:zinc metalloproteinase nas-4-like n=1 Tax=Penaeus monodon TaxID=6687 RepID=UPI0018A73435|nr:zinc metalloproteinase nas-4-like [Penaeus monodon]
MIWREAALLGCVSIALGRLVPPKPREEPQLHPNEPRPDLYPEMPDYVLKSVIDYSSEAQESLLQDHQDAEVVPGLYQGDIAGFKPEQFIAHTRVGLKWDVFPERRWTNDTVPYAISDLYLPSERMVIETAISTVNFLTCIKFVPWDGMREDYLLVWPVEKPAGCWSYVGKTGGQQVLSLQRPDSRSKRCFGSVGKPIHELLHALGIFHEQTRADRDNHVKIIRENIIPQYIHNFAKQSEVNTTFTFDYDYKSVMHYGSHFFSSSRDKPTIVPKVEGVEIGQRRMLSKTDCLKVNQLYGCLDGDAFKRAKYLAFCSYLGL